MSMLKLLTAVGGPTSPTYVDDVFCAYTYTGNGTAQTITNGIDLAGEGGLVWIKERNSAVHHNQVDTVRGVGNALYSSSNFAQASDATGVTGFTPSGFTLGANGSYNGNADTYVSWTFRNSDRFFSQSSVVKTGGSNATVSFPGLGTLGMVIVKRTDSTGSWYVWHRSLTAGKLLYLEQTAAEATLGHITVSGTTVTLINGVIADGNYIVYAWAHDTASDGIVQAGSFTTDGSGNAAVNHGWAAGVQFAAIKASSTSGDWEMYDTARTSGWSGNDARLRANLTNVEDSVARLSASGTSISFAGLSASATYVYVFVVAPT